MTLIDKEKAIETLKTEFLYFSYSSDDPHEAVDQAVKEVRKSVVEIIEDMPEAGQSITWVPVKERLPDKAGHYLGCGRKGGIYLVKYLGDNSNMWWQAGHGSASVRVTAWSELPEPYMENNDNQN